MASCAFAANTLTFTDVSGSSRTNEPMQFGRVFLQGEIADYPKVLVDGTPVATQANVLQRWPDASVKHAIVSFLIASVTASGSKTFTFENQATCNCTPLTKTQMLDAGYDFDATVTVGATTISARTMLNAWDGTTVGVTGFKQWLPGPIANTLIIEDQTAPPADGDIEVSGFYSLRVAFHATFWPTINKVKVRYVMESGNTEAAQDMFYDALLEIGDATPATVFDSTSTLWVAGGIPHRVGTRWTKTGWIGGAPDERYNLDHNLAYMSSTKMLPYYDTAKTVSEAKIAADYAAWTGGTKEIYYPHGSNAYTWSGAMADTGGRVEIGPYPLWYVRWLYTGDYREREIVLGNADLSGNFGVHYREGSSGRFFDIAGTVPALGRTMAPTGRPTITWSNDWTNVSGGTSSVGDRVTPVGPVSPPVGLASRTITAITKANPAVATSTAHGLTVGSFTYANVSGLTGTGWTTLNGTHWIEVLSSTTFSFVGVDSAGFGTLGGTKTFNTTGFGWNLAHLPSIFYVPYMTTGDYYYLEGARFWVTFSAEYTVTGAGDFGRGPSPTGNKCGMVYASQIRSTAWGTRERAEAAYMEPDGTAEKDLFTAWMACQIAILDGVAGLTSSIYNGNTNWVWGNTVRRTNSTITIDDVNLPPIPGTPYFLWQVGSAALSAEADGYGIDDAISYRADNQFGFYYLGYGLGRVYELGFPTDKLLKYSVGPWLNAILLDPGFNPFLLQGGRYTSMKEDGPGYYTSMADMLLAYWPDQATAAMHGATVWRTKNFFGLTDSQNGYEVLGTAATAAAAPHTAAGPTAWAWVLAEVESKPLYNTDSDPRWAILARLSDPTTPSTAVNGTVQFSGGVTIP